jgi:hypothetical protein
VTLWRICTFSFHECDVATSYSTKHSRRRAERDFFLTETSRHDHLWSELTASGTIKKKHVTGVLHPVHCASKSRM